MKITKSKFIEMLNLDKKFIKYVMLDEDDCPLIITPSFMIRAICDNFETVEIVCWDIIQRIHIRTYTSSYIQADYIDKNGLAFPDAISYHDMKIEDAIRFADYATIYFLKEIPKGITINLMTKTEVKMFSLINDVLGIKIKENKNG